jgi:Glycosyltransferase family 87
MTTVVLCLVGSGLLFASLIPERNAVGGGDFLALYSGARLVGSGHMYDPQAVRKVQVETISKYGKALLFTRIPCFGLFLWPLAQLPYATAKYIWISLQLLAVIAAVWLWPGSRRTAVVVVCWSLPVLTCLVDGADTTMLFLWLVLWRRLESQDRPVLAGMALALCIAKFHLFLFLPLLLLRHRRWLVLQGSAIGILVLSALSVAADGWRWPVDFLHVLMMPDINPGQAVMPNLHGLVPGFEVPAIILTVILTGVAIYKLDYLNALAVALAGSLLCSYHAYVMDAVILLPAIILLIELHRSRWPSIVAGIFMTPIPWAAVLLRGQ